MKNLSKLLLLSAAIGIGIGLTVPNPANAKTANSCNEASTQPVAVYDPFVMMQAEMARMNLEMSRMMQAAFNSAANSTPGQSYSSVSFKSTPKEYRVTMTAPGGDQKNMKVSVSANHTLTIQSNKDLAQKASTGQTDHASVSLSQIMSLPADADTDHMQTSYKDGEYTVTVPRKANPERAPDKSPQGQGI